jgi:hypothetical protein
MAPPKKPPTKVITVKILQTHRAKLEKLAQAKGWTLNRLCRSILETHADVQSR